MHFTALAYLLDSSLGAIEPRGSPEGDAVEAMVVAAGCAARRFGPVPIWQFVSGASGGRLLSNTSSPFPAESRSLSPSRPINFGGATRRTPRATRTGAGLPIPKGSKCLSNRSSSSFARSRKYSSCGVRLRPFKSSALKSKFFSFGFLFAAFLASAFRAASRISRALS